MVDEIDSFTGVPAAWESKAILICKYILDKNGEQYSYVEIAEHLNIPSVEIGRYLKEECYEKRDYQWLIDKKKYNFNAYSHYLNNHKIDEDGTLKINFSKHNLLLNVARLMNLDVIYKTVKGKKYVFFFPRMTDERTTIYYEKPEMDHKLLL